MRRRVKKESFMSSATASLEDRLRRNKHYIQRTNAASEAFI